MKTTLKFLALFLVAALPAALAAGFDATTLIGAFAATLVALIAFHDYTRPAHRRHYLASLNRSTPRHAHPYAA